MSERRKNSHKEANRVLSSRFLGQSYVSKLIRSEAEDKAYGQIYKTSALYINFMYFIKKYTKQISSQNAFVVFFNVLLTVHLSIFISIFNQLDAQNLFHNKFYFMPLHVSSTCAYHQEVKIALHSLWYHQTYRCVMQF